MFLQVHRSCTLLLSGIKVYDADEWRRNESHSRYQHWIYWHIYWKEQFEWSSNSSTDFMNPLCGGSRWSKDMDGSSTQSDRTGNLGPTIGFQRVEELTGWCWSSTYWRSDVTVGPQTSSPAVMYWYWSRYHMANWWKIRYSRASQ